VVLLDVLQPPHVQCRVPAYQFHPEQEVSEQARCIPFLDGLPLSLDLLGQAEGDVALPEADFLTFHFPTTTSRYNVFNA
jgi:hypothetical protein